MRRSLRTTLIASLAFPALPALAQSINVDFGNSDSIPSYTYAAVGSPGAWNAFSSLPTNQLFPLVNLHGYTIPAQIYNNGATDLLTQSIPGATGGDAALMNDMILSYNNPVDACIWVQNLLAGTYSVIIYAMTPNDPSLMSRVRVDNATTGPTMVGGAWPGHHVEGITYATFSVTVPAGGTIALHSGLYGGNIQSGMNGFQLVLQTECRADWNSSGSVTVQDIFDFLSAWFANAPTADFNGNGAITVQDIFDFLAAWFAGCP